MPGLVLSEMTRGLLECMDTDEFSEKVIGQLKAGDFSVASPAHNKVRLDERYSDISAAYDKYAPRYWWDDEFDVRGLLEVAGIIRFVIEDRGGQVKIIVCITVTTSFAAMRLLHPESTSLVGVRRGKDTPVWVARAASTAIQ